VFQHFFKGITLTVLLVWVWPLVAAPLQEREVVIEPQLLRPKVVEPNIDALDFELGLFAGFLSVENFSTEPLYGLRLAFYVSEDFFLQADYGRSTLQDSVYRQLGLVIFPQEQESLDFYQLSLGYNLFPGEVFLGKNRAWNSAFYLLAGVGNVRFIEQDHFSYGLGLGYRVIPMERLTLRFDVRDQLFESDLLGVKKLTHNLEVSLGASFYF